MTATAPGEERVVEGLALAEAGEHQAEQGGSARNAARTRPAPVSPGSRSSVTATSGRSWATAASARGAAVGRDCLMAAGCEDGDEEVPDLGIGLGDEDARHGFLPIADPTLRI